MIFDTPRETDLRRTRIWAASSALRAHSYITRVAESDPLISVVGSMPGGNGRNLVIRCGHRASDEGRLWLYDDGSKEPVAPADAEHLADLITYVKGCIGGQQGARM